MIIAGYSSKENTFCCTVWTCLRSDLRNRSQGFGICDGTLCCNTELTTRPTKRRSKWNEPDTHCISSAAYWAKRDRNLVWLRLMR